MTTPPIDECYFVLRFEGSSDYALIEEQWGLRAVRVPFNQAQRWQTREGALAYYNLFFKKHHLGIYRVALSLNKIL